MDRVGHASESVGEGRGRSHRRKFGMSERSLRYHGPSVQPSKRERATPLPPEDRRQAIIEAVVPLLIEHGPTATTRQIAEAAGVAEGTLFRVFPDKRALLFAVAE